MTEDAEVPTEEVDQEDDGGKGSAWDFLKNLDPSKVKTGRKPRTRIRGTLDFRKTSRTGSTRTGTGAVGSVLEVNTQGHQGFSKNPTEAAAERKLNKGQG